MTTDPVIFAGDMESLSSEWRYFLEPNDDGVTRFRTFARSGNFWVAGDD